jgi:hypothetical protein
MITIDSSRMPERCSRSLTAFNFHRAERDITRHQHLKDGSVPLNLRVHSARCVAEHVPGEPFHCPLLLRSVPGPKHTANGVDPFDGVLSPRTIYYRELPLEAAMPEFSKGLQMVISGQPKL